MFRLLKADEIETRVSQISQKGLSLLLYKTARTDANLLDETVGPMNWQNDFKLIDGVLYGGIGIKTDNEYVWKWDCGIESYAEKEKGRASDAFKRAGFKCGIGRELYTAPFIYIPASKCNITEKNGKPVCYDKFVISHIDYNEKREISELSIVNENTGQECYRWSGKQTKEPSKRTAKEPPKSDDIIDGFIPVCKDCGAEITPRVHDYSVSKFKKPLCIDCQKKQ